MKGLSKILLLLFVSILLVDCAKTGRPTGGPKDETAPLFVTANPPYGTTNFDAEKIKIEFDEFITLKDLNKQLVVSPPMKYPPIITPQGSPSRDIRIEILDTLRPNTTYIFNFGNAVQDNNEGNKLENFKYVFSTGTYIDSLKTKGSVKDALSRKDVKNINVLLYEIDSTYNDSIIYNTKPNYVTSTLDTMLFEFTNVKKGKYLMLALQEANSDYLFNPKTDKIAFLQDTIQLPQDSIVNKPLVLFRENQPFDFKRGREVNKGKIQFAFEGGEEKKLEVEVISDVPDDFKSVAKFEMDKDTLNYWFTPIEADSLNFIVKRNEFLDTTTVFLRKKELDSLKITPSVSRTLDLRDTFYFTSNNPIIKIDSTKLNLFDKDTLPVNFKLMSSEKENKVALLFDKKPEQKYQLTALPEAFSDVYNIKNDTLTYNFVTKEIEDYGRISLNIENLKSKNLIVELLSGQNQDQLVERKFINTSTRIVFDLLKPAKYTIRAIIDENKNNKWDTGSFLERILPETIIYHPEINNVELRANYFLEESFTIE